MPTETVSIRDLSESPSRPWEPPRLQELRRAAGDAFLALELPSEDNEEWRYTDLGALDIESLRVLTAEPCASPIDIAQFVANGVPGTCPVVLELLQDRLAGAIAIVDGCAVGNGLSVVVGEMGVEFGDITAFADRYAETGWIALPAVRDKFTALAAAASAGGAFLSVPDGTDVDGVFAIWLNCKEGGLASAPPIQIHLGQDSRARVLVHEMGSPASQSLSLPVIEAFIGARSVLDLAVVQEYGATVDQVENIFADVGEDAEFRLATLTTGGRLARIEVASSMTGEGASSLLLGACLGSGDRQIDCRTLQDHRASRTTSDLLFKSVVDDAASSVYSGLIRVEKDAQKVTGFQANRNLILSEEASAESVPNLEILANDVRCSHASATGPVDEEQLYYLASRGIDEQAAERLLVMGFLGEIIEKMPLPELKPAIKDLINEQLGENGGSHE